MPEKFEYIDSAGPDVHYFRNVVTGQEFAAKFGVSEQEQRTARAASSLEFPEHLKDTVYIPKVVSEDRAILDLSEDTLEEMSKHLGFPINRDLIHESNVLIFERADGYPLKPYIYGLETKVRPTDTVLQRDANDMARLNTVLLEELDPDWIKLQEAVAYMNREGVHHYDLRNTGNIYITEGPSGRAQFQLIDWGWPKDGVNIADDIGLAEGIFNNPKLNDILRRYAGRTKIQYMEGGADLGKVTKNIHAAESLEDLANSAKSARFLRGGSDIMGMGSVFTVVFAMSMSEAAHAAQVNIADELVERKALTADQADDYKEVLQDIRIRNDLQTMDVTPLSMATMFAVEQYAHDRFQEFSDKHDLPESIHQILAPAMIAGSSISGTIHNAVYDALPDDDPSRTMIILQPLAEAKYEILQAERHLEEARSANSNYQYAHILSEDELQAQQNVIDAQAALRQAKTEYERELAITLNDPSGIRAVSLVVGEDALIDIIRASAKYADQNSLNPDLQDFVQAQSALDIHLSLPAFEKEAANYNEMLGIHHKHAFEAETNLRDHPETMRAFLEHRLSEKLDARQVSRDPAFAETVDPVVDVAPAVNTSSNGSGFINTQRIIYPEPWVNPHTGDYSLGEPNIDTSVASPTDQGIQENAIREFLERTNPLIRGLNPDYQITLPLPDATPPIRIIPVITDPELREQSYDAADHTLSNSDIYDTPEYIEMANIFEKIRAGDETDAQEQLLLASLADHNETSPLLRALTQAYPAELQDITRTTATQTLAHQEEITVSEPVRTQMMGLSS